MRFEHKPQLILTKEEFETLDGALKLCRDMDDMTSGEFACENCPINDDCMRMCAGCLYAKAQDALKQIIDMAVVK